MKLLSCAAARRRLEAYHDGELPIGEQIDVAAHVDSCAACADALADLDIMRLAVRCTAPGREPLTAEESDGLQASVINRLGVENTLAWSTRVRELFDDMHFVYAGMGAAAATVTCVMIMLSMMRFAALASPGFNHNPVVVVDARMLMPRAEDQLFYAAPGAVVHGPDDATFTVSGIVTREGRVVNLELHSEEGQLLAAGSREARAVQDMMNALSQARFEPMRVPGGLPIAVNMVWLVAHTTVRGTPVPAALPTAKKRRVDVVGVPPARRLHIA